MAKIQLRNLVLALSFAGIAAAFTGYVFQNRDFIFEWSWAKPHGKMEESVNPQLLAAALEFLEQENPGKICVAQPVGHDDRYLYAGSGCATFPKPGSAGEGDENFRATRFRISGEKVVSAERANPGAYLNSVHRLFPPEAFEKMRYGFSQRDYLKVGQERALSKSSKGP